MSLPFKKRKMNVPLTVKVNRLAKAVSRSKPDRQQYNFTATVNSTTTGYNENLIDCLPSALLDTVSGDFLIESVEYRVTLTSSGNFARGRVDVVIPKAEGVAVSTGVSTDSAYLLDKVLKSYQSTAWYNSTSSPWHNPGAKTRLGLVTKRQGTGVTTGNNPYILVRHIASGTTQVTYTVDVRVTYREK